MPIKQLKGIAHQTINFRRIPFMLVDLHWIAKSPYADIMPIITTRKVEESVIAELHLLQDGRVSLEMIQRSFTHFQAPVVVLWFKLLDNLDLVGKQPELTLQDPLNRISADIQFCRCSPNGLSLTEIKSLPDSCNILLTLLTWGSS